MSKNTIIYKIPLLMILSSIKNKHENEYTNTNLVVIQK